MNNMVLGQQPYESNQNSFKIAVHCVATNTANATAFNVPRTDYENTVGKKSSLLSVSSDVGGTMSLSIVENVNSSIFTQWGKFYC